VILAAVGLIEGGGNPNRMFGADWSLVDWPSVATMLVVTLVIGAILIPATYCCCLAPSSASYDLRHDRRDCATRFDCARDRLRRGQHRRCEGGVRLCALGLQSLSGVISARSAAITSAAFFSDANAPLWHAAIGYEMAGIIGIVAVGGIAYLSLVCFAAAVAGPSAAEAGS